MRDQYTDVKSESSRRDDMEHRPRDKQRKERRRKRSGKNVRSGQNPFSLHYRDIT